MIKEVPLLFMTFLKDFNYVFYNLNIFSYFEQFIRKIIIFFNFIYYSIFNYRQQPYTPGGQNATHGIFLQSSYEKEKFQRIYII